jgi:hypothetical protein
MGEEQAFACANRIARPGRSDAAQRAWLTGGAQLGNPSRGGAKMCEISEVQVVSYFAESDDETGKPKLGQAKEKLPQRANLRGVRAAALRSGAEDQFHLRTARLTRNSSRLSSSLAPPRINGVE